jgi:hypothetical protein
MDVSNPAPSDAPAPPAPTAAPATLFRDFLENKPPGAVCLVGDWVRRHPSRGDMRMLNYPDPIALHCSRCGGLQNFSPEERHNVYDDDLSCFAVYKCRNCATRRKRYALFIGLPRTAGDPARIYKYGEEPAFSIQVSTELRQLLKPDEALLDKAIRCEAASLGIGAFVYYRRILEEMKSRIFDEVEAVAKQIDAGEEAFAWLKKARADRQFTKSVDEIKSAGLHAIYLDGHNPLTLLYDEVSDGVHAGTDAENLVIAERIRLVLGHLAARLAALKLEQAEVKSALTAMLKAKKEREEKRAAGQLKPGAASTGQ